GGRSRSTWSRPTIRWGLSAPRRPARGRYTASRRPLPTRSTTRSASASTNSRSRRIACSKRSRRAGARSACAPRSRRLRRRPARGADMDSMPAFELKRPSSVAEAAALLAADPQARLLAGGTDLVPNLRRGIERPPVLVALGAVAGLDAIATAPEGTWIGAGVRLSRLAADPAIAQAWPAVAQAAGAIAGPGHRSVATVGGNLCLDTRCVFYNQSEWWRASNNYCLKRGGDICHVAPQ